MARSLSSLATAVFLWFSCVSVLPAETGYDAWLRYGPQSGRAETPLPATMAVLDRSPVIASARDEILRGIRGMRNRILRIQTQLPHEDAIVLGLLPSVERALPAAHIEAGLIPDAYLLKAIRTADGVRYTLITAGNDRGVLYGAFAYLRKIQLGEPIDDLNEQQSPYAPVRWVNQWDNLDGSIERGYGGRSIFWDAGHARADLHRVADFGRLLASLGINACAVSNVNADRRLLSPEYLDDIRRIAAAFRPWGVQVVLAVDFGSPQSVGELDTFDPLDTHVAAWWTSEANALYEAVPDLAGFVIKADSEGRVGPSFYHRTHADAANVVARALKPHGGVLAYRGFVYDHHMDWRNPRNDRARAAYDNFQKLDGQFDDNVLLQIKNGPIDFQVREPVSPLIGALEKTNQALELQITQEYLGQARHLVFLAPQWKEILDFDLHASSGFTPVKALVAGKTFHRPIGGFVGVSNIGLDENWTGNHLSQANLYSFGRLAWNPNLTARAIADEWTRFTFGDNPEVVRTITHMQLTSWRTYEDYTGPLGLQTLTDIVGDHYGVSVEASENNGWGQWHRADAKGVGMDRSAATGTGYAGQYRQAIAERYERVETTPDDLLLFFHHVAYEHLLHSGQSVIQYIYDSHYRAAAAVEAYVRDWNSLANQIDESRFAAVREQLEYQAGQSELWRDAVCNWFLRASGIADEGKRVGHEPGRVEAESMTLEGYSVVDVKPWEAASGGKAVICRQASCTAEMRYRGAAGWHAIRIRYFDRSSGIAHFRVWVRDQLVDAWDAAEALPIAKPTTKLDGSSSMLRSTPEITLRPGDRIRIEGRPGGNDSAALDYVEVIH